MSSPTLFPITATIIFSDSEGFIFEVIGSHGDIYIVGFDYQDGWYCPCPDYMYRRHECKHVRACKELLNAQHVNVQDDLFCEVTA